MLNVVAATLVENRTTTCHDFKRVIAFLDEMVVAVLVGVDDYVFHCFTFCCCLLCPKYIIYIVICQPLSTPKMEFSRK